jgi:hypothetical protein
MTAPVAWRRRIITLIKISCSARPLLSAISPWRVRSGWRRSAAYELLAPRPLFASTALGIIGINPIMVVAGSALPR